MKKNVVALVLAMALTAFSGVSPMTVNAQDLVNSIPSQSTDESVGEDVTQGKRTEYQTLPEISQSTYTGSEEVKVYATKTGSVVVTIPKVVILGKNASDSSYMGDANVKFKGDIAGSQTVNLSAEVKTSMAESGGKTGTATTEVKVNNTDSFSASANDLAQGEVKATLNVKATGITAGSWNGSLLLHINVENN